MNRPIFATISLGLTKTHQNLSKIIKLSAPEALLYFVVLDSLRQYFLYTQSLIQKNSYDVGPFNPATAGIACTAILSALIFTFLFTLRAHDVFEGHKKKTPLWKYVKPLTMPLITEGLRGLTRVLIGFLFFIIPGFYFYVRVKFLNHIVLFDKRYQEGEGSDALAESYKLTKGKTTLLTLLLFEVGFQVLVYFAEGEFAKYPSFVSPLTWMVLIPILLFIYIYYQALNYAIFRELFLANKGVFVESNFQTQRTKN